MTLAVIAGKEILSELFKKQIHAQDIPYQTDKDNKSFMEKNQKKPHCSRTVKSTVVLLA